MAGIFVRLERVLNLEAQQGYQDKAVVGGIRQFAVYWVGQAREGLSDEADLALVEQVSEVLMNYGRLPGPEARERAIESLANGLQKRRSRLSISEPEPKKPVIKTKSDLLIISLTPAYSSSTTAHTGKIPQKHAQQQHNG